jgi:hypothetical protein
MTDLKHKDIKHSLLDTDPCTADSYIYLDILNTTKTDHYQAIRAVHQMEEDYSGDYQKPIYKRLITVWNFCSGVSYKKLVKLMNEGVTLKDILEK